MEEIKVLEKESNSVTFWDDSEKAQKILKKMNHLKETIASITEVKNMIQDGLEMIALLESQMDDELFSLVTDDCLKLESRISYLELEVLLSGEYDYNNAILEIHSGAGGTEAQDWANMLYRMYDRWCNSKGYHVEVLDILDGEEAGIKRVTLFVSGPNAYGYLKCEKGIHRLVSSVDVVPEVDDSIDIEVKEEDLKIDVYRSSGAGGQSVNTTDSAVRITHLPTGIVVTCQNERSQLKNKEKALSILKGKLKILEEEKKESELVALKGDNKKIDFGSQIRSYVMHPYSMVKDHRTGIETSNVSKVLDGDIDMFIDGYLRS